MFCTVAHSPLGERWRVTPAVSDGEAQPAVAAGPASAAVRWRSGWSAARLALFVAVTVLLTFRDLGRLTTHLPGDPGDAFLILSLLDWGAARTPHLYHGYWDGPMFSAGSAVMAYTDTFLPLTPVFGILKFVTGSRTLAFNLLFLGSWVFCAEATYHLAQRLVASRLVATVAAIAFTFSTIRLQQTNHFQLAWAGLIPLALLLLLRLRDRPTVVLGIAAALAVVSQVLISAYYGVILLGFTGVFILVALTLAWRAGTLRQSAAGFGALLGTLVVLMFPIQHVYSVAGDETGHRRGYPHHGRMLLGDLRAPAPSAPLPRLLPWFDTPSRGSENFAYPGFFVWVLIPTLVAIAAIKLRRHGIRRPTFDWVAVTALGAYSGALAAGRGPVMGIRLPAWDFTEAVLPGFSSIVALVRLYVFAQLALVLGAAYALALLLRRAGLRARAIVAACLVVLITAEAWQTHTFVEVVEVTDGSVYDVMQGLDAGIVLELPMAPYHLGGLYAFTETPRMVLGLDDALQSFNGYSGHAPASYEEAALAINTFPETASILELERHKIDYIVIHTAAMDTGLPSISAAVNAAGFAFWSDDQVADRLTRVPSGLVAESIHASDGLVLVLRDDFAP